MNPIINYFNGNFPITISFYCILLIGVVVITTLLSKLCVILKVKTHLSDGVVAGLLLGVITSLPELVTCIASVLVHKTGTLGFGDIIGSNIFDIFILAICLIACIWIFRKKKANQVNTTTVIFTGIGTIFVLLAMVAENWIPSLIWHGFNFFSILILLSYAGSIFFMVRGAKVKPKNKNEGLTEIKQAKQSKLFKLNLGWVISLIAIAAFVLIACAVFLTFTSESLIFNHWSSVFGTEEKASFGGALLLGVVTSLPEIVCCINLCINKEYNMVIDSIVGSTSFNLSILTIANIAYACIASEPGMYSWTSYNLTQVIVGIVMCAVMVLYLIANSSKFKTKLSEQKTISINALLLSIVISAYIVFLILGFIWK